jgi:hypothetical protein
VGRDKIHFASVIRRSVAVGIAQATDGGVVFTGNDVCLFGIYAIAATKQFAVRTDRTVSPAAVVFPAVGKGSIAFARTIFKGKENVISDGCVSDATARFGGCAGFLQTDAVVVFDVADLCLLISARDSIEWLFE